MTNTIGYEADCTPKPVDRTVTGGYDVVGGVRYDWHPCGNKRCSLFAPPSRIYCKKHDARLGED